MTPNGNNKNGTRLIISVITAIALTVGGLHTIFIRPLQMQIEELKMDVKDKTVDRWTKVDAIRAHDKLEEMIDRCCQSK